MKEIISKYFLVATFFCYSISFSQTNLIDTFSINKDLKKVEFKNDWFYKNHSVAVYYKKSKCTSKFEKVGDTLDDYLIESRMYYNDSIFIIKNFSKSFKINKGIQILLSTKEKKILDISLRFSNDSLIKNLDVFYCNRKNDNPYTGMDLLFSSQFSKPTTIDNFSPIKLDKENWLQVYFYREYKSSIRRIIFGNDYFENNNSKHINANYEFYPNNKLKSITYYYPPQGRFGKAYTYYENGKLCSEGEYNGSEFDSDLNEFNVKKTGKWFYYNIFGCIEKEEIWDNGVLIYPLTKKIKKSAKK